MSKRRKPKYLSIPNRILTTHLPIRSKFVFAFITQQINLKLRHHHYPCFTFTNNKISHTLNFSSTVTSRSISTLKRKRYISTTPIKRNLKHRTITLTKYGWFYNIGNYISIPNTIINSNLTLNRQLVLGYILSWHSSFFQRDKTIARKTGIRIGTVRSSINYLVKHHYLHITKPNQNDKHRYLAISKLLQIRIDSDNNRNNQNNKIIGKVNGVASKIMSKIMK